MTREEAIGHIKDVICENNSIKPNIVVFEQEKEALYMAIKALEQEHCRDMKEIRELISCDADAETKLKMISNILTAKPHYFEKPQTGHWIKSNIGGAKVCSVCNAHIGLSSFKFCPSCGAKMFEPQESKV